MFISLLLTFKAFKKCFTFLSLQKLTTAKIILGYIPPGRPKQLKEKCLTRLHDDISQKIEANQLEVRDENKMWLVRSVNEAFPLPQSVNLQHLIFL